MIMRSVHWKALKRVVAFSFFLLIMWQSFVHLTYLFRNADARRMNYLSFYEEKENSLDVVLVGGSNVFVYWDPMQAWGSHGITSFDYSMDSMPAAVMLTAVKEIVKTQSPKVIVIDVRKFLTSFWDTEMTGGIGIS